SPRLVTGLSRGHGGGASLSPLRSCAVAMAAVEPIPAAPAVPSVAPSTSRTSASAASARTARRPPCTPCVPSVVPVVSVLTSCPFRLLPSVPYCRPGHWDPIRPAAGGGIAQIADSAPRPPRRLRAAGRQFRRAAGLPAGAGIAGLVRS